MVKQIQLIIRLLKDKRVHPLIKMLPLLSLVYLIWSPDLLFGPIDDTVVIALFIQFFLALVPDEIIDELKIDQEIQEDSLAEREDIIEGEFWEEWPQAFKKENSLRGSFFVRIGLEKILFVIPIIELQFELNIFPGLPNPKLDHVSIVSFLKMGCDNGDLIR